MVRFKHRYITIEIDPLKIPKLDSWELKSPKLYWAVVKALEVLHGDFGVAVTASGLSVRYCNKETRIGIIKCRHGPHRLVASVLPFINEIDKDSVQIRTLYTGATLQQCYKFIQRYQLDHLRKFYNILSTENKQKYIEYEKDVLNLAELKTINKRKNPETPVLENSDQACLATQ